MDELDVDQIREYRGTLTEPGKESPWRNRSIEENLDLFVRMRNGEFESGEKVLRAKIDMASPNINMRDPVIYRIKKEHHHRTGDKWCIYPCRMPLKALPTPFAQSNIQTIDPSMIGFWKSLK